MEPNDKAAVLAALLAMLDEEGQAQATGTENVWARSGHPHIRSWNWQPRSQDAWRLHGRLALMRARQLPRV